jgi:hypothetical protein
VYCGLRKDLSRGLGMVVHTCNPSYWEVEVGRITVQGQLRQKLSETAISTSKLDMVVVHICNPSYVGA